METAVKKQVKTNKRSTKNQKVKKLSKVGEWLRSGKSIGGTYDIRAILK